jgi:pimeloyl-ACP methyl ester carboxylesterase
MTENPKSEYTVNAEMDHLYAFLKLLKVDRIYVIGQSTGAYHAARIALEHPEMVKALVLADSATLSPPMGNLQERRAAIGLGTGAGPQSAGSPKEQARAALIALSKKNREHITEEFLSAAEYMADQPSGKQTDAAMLTDVAKRYEVIINNGAEEMRQWIKDGKLQTPTLLYWGKNDPVIRLDRREKQECADDHHQRCRAFSLPRTSERIRTQRDQFSLELVVARVPYSRVFTWRTSLLCNRPINLCRSRHVY